MIDAKSSDPAKNSLTSIEKLIKELETRMNSAEGQRNYMAGQADQVGDTITSRMQVCEKLLEDVEGKVQTYTGVTPNSRRSVLRQRREAAANAT